MVGVCGESGKGSDLNGDSRAHGIRRHCWHDDDKKPLTLPAESSSEPRGWTSGSLSSVITNPLLVKCVSVWGSG